jgi:histidine phosphotransferase ChpT
MVQSSPRSNSGVVLDVRVLELLVSRLCHDMVSPIGAVNNGIELIEEMGAELGGQATELIAESGRQAAARLQCFRLAYGMAGSQASISLRELHDVAGGWLSGGKVSMAWRLRQEDAPADPPPGLAKVLLNAVVLAGETLSYGGSVAVGPAPEGFGVEASGRTAMLGDAERAALEGRAPVEALTPRTVHAYATGLFARHYGLDLACSQPAADRLVLTLSIPGRSV